jgi:hypothetical protein
MVPRILEEIREICGEGQRGGFTETVEGTRLAL